MFAVIFETTPNPPEFGQYLDIAAALKPKLLAIEGFLENERFRRDDDAGSLLSLSFWRDEKSLIRWRTQELHHQSQVRGRAGVLSDYRLRIGEVVATMDNAGYRQSEATRTDVTHDCDSQFATISINAHADDVLSLGGWSDQLIARVEFTSITVPEQRLLLLSWRSREAAEQWLGQCQGTVQGRAFGVNIIRTYGLQDRYEAPVFHAPVSRP